MVLTSEDHKRLVQEGVQILGAVNHDAQSKNKPFVVVGDPDQYDVVTTRTLGGKRWQISYVP